MPILSKYVLLSALILFTGQLSAANHPGSVDFSAFEEFGSETVVDVRIGGWLMGLVRQATENDEDLDVLRTVKEVQIRVVEVDNGKLGDLRDRANYFMGQLNADGWEEMVTVNGEDEYVRIVVKGDEDSLDGVTIIALDDDDEAVFVNIIGSIKPEQVAKLISGEGGLDLNLDLDL